MERRKQQVKSYLQSVVNPILKPIVQAIVKVQPPNIMKFIYQYAQKQLKLEDFPEELKQAAQVSSSQQVDKLQQEALAEKIAQKRGKAADKNYVRKGISAEVFGEFNKKGLFEARVIKKSEDSISFIKNLLQNSIMFQNLSQENMKIVIDAMQERKLTVNQQIITEGEDGDMLYLIGSGEYLCTKIINGNKTYLKTYKSGDLFGQLSLMYNSKRAASIKCVKSGTLYALDRPTFTSIAQESAIKKRKDYMKIIQEIQILSEVSDKEKQQLCDAFREENYEPSNYIVKEGEDGDRFYFIVEGNLVAEKHNPKTGKSEVVFKYKDRQFFGQIALIKNTTRQASIKAVTKCKLLSIGRDQFRRLLGPIEDILQRNSLKYKKFIAN